MKRDISDMLDTYVDEGIRLDTITPLSSSRIKELTMGKIQKTYYLGSYENLEDAVAVRKEAENRVRDDAEKLLEQLRQKK